MSVRKALKTTHLVATIWFALCVGYILILALRQAGVNWWLIFSLSGNSAVLVFMLVSLYVFAVVKGVSQAQQNPVEHPLTTTDYYMALYVTAPLLGALAGCLSMVGVQSATQFPAWIALGTLGATFCFWVVVDPLTSSVETLTPAGRLHREERLARVEAERREKQLRREHLLAQAVAREQAERTHWRQTMRPQIERLAELLATCPADLDQAEQEAVNIGAKAWQIGGLTCMKEIHDIALTMTRQQHADQPVTDHVSLWWDGIGDWRRASHAS